MNVLCGDNSSRITRVRVNHFCTRGLRASSPLQIPLQYISVVWGRITAYTRVSCTPSPSPHRPNRSSDYSRSFFGGVSPPLTGKSVFWYRLRVCKKLNVASPRWRAVPFRMSLFKKKDDGGNCSKTNGVCCKKLRASCHKR